MIGRPIAGVLLALLGSLALVVGVLVTDGWGWPMALYTATQYWPFVSVLILVVSIRPLWRAPKLTRAIGFCAGVVAIVTSVWVSVELWELALISTSLTGS